VNLWALVPVKPLDQAKSRLAGTLGAEERAALVRTLLEHTLDALRKVPVILGTVVVTSDPGVAEWASAAGSQVVREAGKPSLNRALRDASRSALAQGAEAVLVMHADLPLVAAEDIEAIISSAQAAPTVVIAPDRHGLGTNALLCAPPSLIEYRFGPDSFALHCAQAQAAGARLEVCSRPGLALDLDTPEDFALWQAECAGAAMAAPRTGRDTNASSAGPIEQGGTP
jgi:2-phospho-L-lactate/phosphoenolpyruvate guanylyltransferase